MISWSLYAAALFTMFVCTAELETKQRIAVFIAITVARITGYASGLGK